MFSHKLVFLNLDLIEGVPNIQKHTKPIGLYNESIFEK